VLAGSNESMVRLLGSSVEDLAVRGLSPLLAQFFFVVVLQYFLANFIHQCNLHSVPNMYILGTGFLRICSKLKIEFVAKLL